MIRSISPNTGDPRDRFTVTIIGDGLTAAHSVSLGTGVAVMNPPKIIGDGEIRVKIEIEGTAIHGPRDVVVKLPTRDDPLPGGFTVNKI